MARRVNAKEALRMLLESDSGENLDNDTYGNSDDFSNESDDESMADGIDFSINTHSMSNDDGGFSESHRRMVKPSIIRSESITLTLNRSLIRTIKPIMRLVTMMLVRSQ